MTLYVRRDTGLVVHEKHYFATMNLIKILYRLKAVSHDQALDIATLYSDLFV